MLKLTQEHYPVNRKYKKMLKEEIIQYDIG